MQADINLPARAGTRWRQSPPRAHHGVNITPHGVLPNHLPRKVGTQVFRELGERYLLLYVRADQIAGVPTDLSRMRWVTPSLLTPAEAATMLVTPDPHRRRSYAIMLDP